MFGGCGNLVSIIEELLHAICGDLLSMHYQIFCLINEST